MSPAAGKTADGSSFTYGIRSPGALGPATQVDVEGFNTSERRNSDGAS